MILCVEWMSGTGRASIDSLDRHRTELSHVVVSGNVGFARFQTAPWGVLFRPGAFLMFECLRRNGEMKLSMLLFLPGIHSGPLRGIQMLQV